MRNQRSIRFICVRAASTRRQRYRQGRLAWRVAVVFALTVGAGLTWLGLFALPKTAASDPATFHAPNIVAGLLPADPDGRGLAETSLLEPDPAPGPPRPPRDAGEADYDFASTATPNPVPQGGTVILRMTLTYRPQAVGPQVNATNVIITDTLPPEFVFVAVTPNPDYTCVTPAVGTHGPITCTRKSDITPGTADTFEVIARATGCWTGAVEVRTTVAFETLSTPRQTKQVSSPPGRLSLTCAGDSTPTPGRASPPAAAPTNLKLITPVRIVDTRPSAGWTVHTGVEPDGQAIPVAPIPGGSSANPEPTTRRFLVAGQTFAGTAIPANVTGLLINVTSIRTEGSDGYVVVFGGDVSAPNVSTLNPMTPLASNFWATRIAPAGGPFPGTIAVFSTDTLDIAIDVVGYLQP